MRKKTGALFLALCISIIGTPITAFAAPKEENAKLGVDWEFAAPHYGTKDTQARENALLGQVTEMTAAWQETVEALAPVTYGHNVKVDNYSDADSLGIIYESVGSGVVMAMDENLVYIATAAHCLKREHTFVEFADGARHEAFIAYRNSAKDVGFLLVSREVLSEETLSAISPATGADAEALGKVQGDMLFTLNASQKPNGEVFAGILDQYSVAYPNNPEQNVLQFYSMVSYGSSGAALYTAEGIWIGNISGGDTYGTCWAVPYQDILEEFTFWLTEFAMQQDTAA